MDVPKGTILSKYKLIIDPKKMSRYSRQTYAEPIQFSLFLKNNNFDDFYFIFIFILCSRKNEHKIMRGGGETA